MSYFKSHPRVLAHIGVDVVPGRSTEVIGGNYLIRYIFGAMGTALAIPAIEHIGVGWFCTISTAFMLLVCGAMILVIQDKIPHVRHTGKHLDESSKE